MGGKANGANGGVERSEHARGNEHFGPAESVEQCGFAGIGISDQRDSAERNGVARLAAQRALFADVFNAGLNFADGIGEGGGIVLYFLSPGPASADRPSASACAPCPATAAFAAQAGHRRAASGQARQKII